MKYLIIGGGPAGSVLWCQLLQSGCQDVTVIEKEVFPRHHIGESLQPDVVKVFDAIGIPRTELARFPKKYGAVYTWGKYRERWSVLYDKDLDTAWESGKKIDIDTSKEYGFNVDRKYFDSLLAQRFLELWGKIVHDTVIHITHGEHAEISSVTLRNSGQIEADFYVDASGQNSLMAQQLGIKEFDPLLRNSAIYGYYKNYHALDPLLGKDFQYIEHLWDCWFWWIPVSYDLVSVGMVFNSERKYTKDHFYEKIKTSWIWSSVADAPFCDAYGIPTEKHYYISDWSFVSSQMTGKNWCFVGDAAGFVDPILSWGASFAMEKAIFLARILSLWEGSDVSNQEKLMKVYETKYRSDLQNYLKMAHAWYEYGNSKQAWLELWGGKSWFIDSISGGKRFFEQNRIFQSWQNEKIFQHLQWQ